MKATSKRQKMLRKRGAGRPRKAGLLRTASGRLSRSLEAKEIEEEARKQEKKLELEAATWKRRQRFDADGNPYIDESISPQTAAKQEYGSVIHAWKLASDAFKKRHGDKVPNPAEFTAQNLDTAIRIHEAYSAYRAAIAAREPRSSSDFSGPGGFDGTDPFADDRAKRDQRAIERWAGENGIRRAILKSGSLGMMAVESIILENKPIDKLRGDLRLALNEVDRIGRQEKAA